MQCSGSRPTNRALNFSRRISGGKNTPWPTLLKCATFAAPGTCPATGSIGSTSPRYRSGARESMIRYSGSERTRSTPWASTQTSGRRRGVKPPFFSGGISLEEAPPAAAHLGQPPLSTATASWPSHRRKRPYPGGHGAPHVVVSDYLGLGANSPSGKNGSNRIDFQAGDASLFCLFLLSRKDLRRGGHSTPRGYALPDKPFFPLPCWTN